MKYTKIFLVVYIIVGLADTLSWIIPSDLLHTISKPLIMPVLMAYIIQVSITKGKFDYRNMILLVSLVFYWAGDTIVMINKDLSFVGALGMLLIGMIISIYAFFIATDKLSVKPLLAVPYLAFGTIFYVILLPELGAFAGPTTVFALVMVTVPFIAHCRKGQTTQESFQHVLIGSILLLISNCIAGIDRFGIVANVFTAAGSIATYCAAHWLIVQGIMLHPLKETAEEALPI